MNQDIFFKNFELLADAPNGVQKLRELILQLAVMGKLVLQDSNDEPASVLSKKSAKSLKPVQENEISFDSPTGWIFTHMDQVSNAIHYGYTASANNSLTDVRLLRITDIQSNKVNWETVPGCEIDTQKLKSYALNNNDLLIARTGGTIGKSYLVENLALKAVFASYLIRIVPNNLIFPKYLKIYADSPLYWNQLYSKCAGTGQPNVNATSLKSLIVPLPPLAEQKRIVSKVDELMALCDKLEARRQKKQELQSKLNSAALDRMLSAENQEEFEQHWQRICENFDLLYDNPENVEKLRQAILQLAVQGKLVEQIPEDEPASVLIEKIEADIKKLVEKGNKKKLTQINSNNEFFELPRSWEWIQLGKLITFGPKNGYSPKPADFVTNTKSLTLSATTSGKFRDDCFKYIDENIESNSHLWLEENDILIQRGNSIEYVGIAAVYKGSSHNFIYPDLMMKLRAHKDVNIDFIHIALNSKFSRTYFADNASGTSGSMPKINQNTVINLPIPLPPLAEQKRIVEKVEQFMELCDELESKLRKSREDSEKLMEAVVKGLLEGAATEKTEVDTPIPLPVAKIQSK
jgi:type I restriction enzyme S subunit